MVICSTFILFSIQTFVIHLGHQKVKRKTLKTLCTLQSLCSTYLLHRFQRWPSFNEDGKLIPLMLSLINLPCFCEYLPFNLPPSSLWVFVAKGWSWRLECMSYVGIYSPSMHSQLLKLWCVLCVHLLFFQFALKFDCLEWILKSWSNFWCMYIYFSN